MNSEEAMQCALGYAWGREDASGILTTGPAGLAGSVPAGWAGFAAAYAQGWDEFNSGRRGSMTSVASAYDRWQATRGATIFSNIDAPAPSQETGKHAEHGSSPAGCAGRYSECDHNKPGS